jgi:hypothetical protein
MTLKLGRPWVRAALLLPPFRTTVESCGLCCSASFVPERKKLASAARNHDNWCFGLKSWTLILDCLYLLFLKKNKNNKNKKMIGKSLL